IRRAQFYSGQLRSLLDVRCWMFDVRCSSYPAMRSLIIFLLLFVFLPARADDPAPFEIREGDRVVLLGDALLERENTYGYLETRMHEQFPDRKFIVRNLSWAGDTPRGWSRASFDPPEKGFERLK